MAEPLPSAASPARAAPSPSTCRVRSRYRNLSHRVPYRSRMDPRCRNRSRSLSLILSGVVSFDLDPLRTLPVPLVYCHLRDRRVVARTRDRITSEASVHLIDLVEEAVDR